MNMKSTKETGHQGIQTCHLCGKVQCGQRLGRVKCAYCSRIFCLQQLQRKFGIIATANDPCFKCPRCTGICCCMCNCQRPPPHVHCKVYKVRQNKVNMDSRVLLRKIRQTESEKNRQSPPLLPVTLRTFHFRTTRFRFPRPFQFLLPIPSRWRW